MQQQPQMIPMAQSLPPTNISTEQIQKYLDENRKLILAIMDNQNLGKLAECAQYQAVLQKNLMYLAAIADAQPQATPIMPPQMATHPAMQQGGYFMQQQPQAAAVAPQPGLVPQKMPVQFNNPHHVQDPQQQLQQAIQGQMGIRPGGGGGGDAGSNRQGSGATGRGGGGGDGAEHGK